MLTIGDNIDIPASGIKMAYGNAGTIGAGVAKILISPNPDHHPTAGYIQGLRETLPGESAGTTFAFLPADILTQILNFGLPATIDEQGIADPHIQAALTFWLNPANGVSYPGVVRMVISFTPASLAAGESAFSTAREAGATRFRQVLMTAVAMTNRPRQIRPGRFVLNRH